MTELWVKDGDGKARDIIQGYDDNVSSLCHLFILSADKMTVTSHAD